MTMSKVGIHSETFENSFILMHFRELKFKIFKHEKLGMTSENIKEILGSLFYSHNHFNDNLTKCLILSTNA